MPPPLSRKTRLGLGFSLFRQFVYDINRNFSIEHCITKLGFTLAEVLITLGIIGIIAAMTLPSLLANYKKQEIATRLSKAYSTLLNAIRMSESHNGEMRIWPQGESLDVDEFWTKYLNPYLSGAKLCDTCRTCGYPKDCTNVIWSSKWTGDGGTWSLESSSSRLLFQLSDGTVIFFPKNSTDSYGNPTFVNSIFIDVNGSLGPNESCKDVFFFERDYQKGSISAPKGDCSLNKKYCTNEIISNGWKIPEDYPCKL